MAWKNILGNENEQLFPTKRKIRFDDEDKPKKLSPKQVGCQYCPLNDVKGIKKVFGVVEGKDIFIWGMAPGPQENRDEKEFIGPSGDFLWAELRRVGIRRSDCDIQNVVRCFPADRDEDQYPALKMRNPSKEEIHCCSVYTKQAIQKSQAKVHLIFGEVAHKAVLGAEYSKGKKIFWSDRLQAHVVCLYHPSYFIRMGYRVGSEQSPNSTLIQWRADLDHAASLTESGGKYGYIEEQNYIGIVEPWEADIAYKNIKRAAKKGWRVAVDIEDGVLEDEGRRAILCCGFSYKKGQAYVFLLDHKTGIKASRENRDYNWEIVRKIIADPEIKKVLHHGTSDAAGLLKLMGVKMEGYDYDTEFGEYFYDASAKAYGLLAIANRRYPEFSGYKEITAPEIFTKSFRDSIPVNTKLPLAKQYKMAKDRGALNVAQVPWDKLILYNGGDCDLTKRVELSTKKAVNMPLMYLYRDAGFLTAAMEKYGPLFDYRQQERMMELYPYKIRKWKRKLRRIAQDEKFNPASTQQVLDLLFGTLGLEMPNDEKPNTQADTLELMKDQHPAVDLVLRFRRDSKVLSTYLTGFKNSADMHEGRVATQWWLTGTSTGRMSSGQGKEKSALERGLVNLQNIISDHDLQNMIVSTTEWREIYRYWKKNGPFTDATWRQFEDMDVFLGFDQGQFEIRVVAQRSGDKNLIEVFERGEDIHASVGNRLLGMDKSILEKEGPERVSVKGMHFGIIYGLMAQGLWQHICATIRKGIEDGKLPSDTQLPTLQWVQDLLDNYFRTYRRVKEMIEGDHKQAEELGYVETMFGFRRWLNVQEQKDLGAQWKGAYWKNQAANTPIQGTAHQLLLMGLVNIIREPEKYKLLQRAQMEVHDAMYFVVKLKDLWKAIPLGIDMLEKQALKIVREEFGIDWKVPLKVEPKAGFRFGVQVYKLGTKGPKTTAEFLNAWCSQNQKTERELQEQLNKIR